MNIWMSVILLVVGMVGIYAVWAHAKEGAGEPENVLRHTVKDIKGNDVDLSMYLGKVVMIVNVASKCGFTGQYAGLEALYKKYQDQGFVILGFPANDFLGQEPGTDAEISTFCSLNYGVTFPMFSKVVVTGKEKAPLYRDLTGKQANPRFSGGIKWNFTKFLLDREGRVIDRFAPTTAPDSDGLVKAVEQALGSKTEGEAKE